MYETEDKLFRFRYTVVLYRAITYAERAVIYTSYTDN